jgi:hypothetical protein
VRREGDSCGPVRVTAPSATSTLSPPSTSTPTPTPMSLALARLVDSAAVRSMAAMSAAR